jgi:hypothetical protein
MEYQEEYPKKIKIKAGDAAVYTFDISYGKDDGFGIQDYFGCIPLIDELHEEFIEWLMWFWYANPNDAKFPWKEYNAKGIELTKKLSIILKGTGIEIFYQNIHQETDERNSDLIKVN